VAGIVGDSAVEYILHGMFPEEEIAEDPHFTAKFPVGPQTAEISDGIDVLFACFEFLEKFIVGN
jgi:hypothetical protein